MDWLAAAEEREDGPPVPKLDAYRVRELLFSSVSLATDQAGVVRGDVEA